MTEQTYEYHAKCENEACRDFSFLFAAVTQYPVMCRVCQNECKVVAVHPMKKN